MKQTINWEEATRLKVNNDTDTFTFYSTSTSKIAEFSLYNGDEEYYEGDCLLISKTTGEKFNLWFIHKERLPIVVVKQVGFKKNLFKE